MSAPFDPEAVERLGWRQGAVLRPVLLQTAAGVAPDGVVVGDTDWLVVTSHDCDVLNFSLAKEPVVEVLRAAVLERSAADKQFTLGRNPRKLQLERHDGGHPFVLEFRPHERWSIPRELLAGEAPAGQLENGPRRLIAEWLAKRYFRAAFPSAFDRRWHHKLGAWTKLLERRSQLVQGVYLRLSSLDELADGDPYGCHLIVAVPADEVGSEGWAEKKHELETVIEEFWGQFAPGIRFDGVDVLGTNELTLAEIEPYQRFDADWVSLGGDTERVALETDLKT